MAVFDDLTGWRDELEAFAQSKEGDAYFQAFLETRPDLSCDDDEYWDLQPVDAAETRKTFIRWHGLKAGLPSSYSALAYGIQLAIDLLAGELTSLDYAEASAFSRKHYGTSFIYREEGA